jgi:transposase InsO family protein
MSAAFCAITNSAEPAIWNLPSRCTATNIPNPGDLLHLDTKKLAPIARLGHRLTGDPRDQTRGAGWEMLHVAIDDHSRIAFSQMHSNERADSTLAFLHAAVAYYERFGIRIRRVLTDNAPCYYSHLFAQACRQLGIRHLRTRHSDGVTTYNYTIS